MRVFQLKTDPRRYCNFALADPADATVYDAFDGTSIAAKWRTIRITAADEPDDTAELGDYALLGTIPVFSLRAVDALLDLLKEGGNCFRFGTHEVNTSPTTSRVCSTRSIKMHL